MTREAEQIRELTARVAQLEEQVNHAHEPRDFPHPEHDGLSINKFRLTDVHTRGFINVSVCKLCRCTYLPKE